MARVQSSISGEEARYMLMITIFWPNVSAPVSIRLRKLYHADSRINPAPVAPGAGASQTEGRP
jgi:hypothetical protein